MDKSFIEKIIEVSRPEQIDVVEYGKYSMRHRTAVYDGNNERYYIENVTPKEIAIHSSRALVEYVKSELERRDKKDGDNASLRIGLKGAYFVADDDFDEGRATYTRQLSQQWDVLTEINGRYMNHEEFLMTLLKLSPSILDFKKTYASFLKVRIVGNSEMVSNPVFVNNQAESGYLVKYKLDGGQGADSVIPDTLKVSVPYIKASDKKYDVDIDVQILNDENNQLKIKINIPLIENIEEKAIIDEIASIKKELEEHSKLLVLSDI